ncbi:peptidase domain-containing ABC transporter [Blastomonas sp. RAC04]|uniref:peptidase domain-containing ABC transporter n=1 Tax=Blastomonas sp. RAC04 TaxID=1842535 RepID=UPI000A6B4BAF|nr:peptidase domain-containing ABC transporter [Blastomonas sp. RAC04]
MLQAEAAECGLACLAMVAAHHGHRVNIGGLRRQFPVSMKGATLAQLIQIASRLDLAPRPLRLELDELHKLTTPAILHWDLNHFVVLERVDARSITILDPATGRREVPMALVNRHFTGVALELTPTANFKPIDARVTVHLSDLWGRLINFRSAFTQLLLLSLLLQMTALALPFFMQLTIDEAIGQSDGNLVILLLVGFGLVYAVNILIKALRSWVVLTLGQMISFQLGGNIIRHMLHLPTRYFESRHVGDLMSRLQSVGPIQSILTQGIVNALIDAMLAITTLVVMALVSIPLMIVTVATTVLYILFRAAIYPAIRRRTEEELIADAHEDTYTMETMRSMRAIKLHVNEAVREAGWRNRYADVITASYRTETYRIWSRLAEGFITNGQFLALVGIAALSVIANEMTIGVMLAFLAYRASFMDSATSLIDHAERWRLLSVHLERLSDIVSERREDVIHSMPREQLLAAPEIIVEDMTFGYDSDQKPVFTNLSFAIPAGSFVAIVGESGAGKSTLMRILLGLMKPQSGRLLIDGQPMGPTNTTTWRARISAVMQDDHLLSGTLADNICFFAEHANMQHIERASRMARIHDTIMAMPMGYQSLIGDMGNALSAGQRQRVLLARALYRDPDAIFLDEGTANLDEENEAAIGDMLAKLPITRVAITHRPALVDRADFVLRMVDGRMMVERGAIGGAETTQPMVQTG